MAFNIQSHRELTQIETRQDPALGIMKWGRTNTFPQTLKNLVEQSPNAKPAIKRTSRFLTGAGFEGENEIVSPYGLTLKKVVQIMADDYAMFESFAIQVNYNIEGKITSINPMRIATLRYSEFDELDYASKIGYHPDFGRNSEVVRTIVHTVTRGKIKWFDRFNPNVVLEQIEKTDGGIGNYLGQMLYHSEEGHSSYPIPPLQAPINFVLSDIENSILIRKETATGFISSYLLKTSMNSEDPTLIALETAIDEAQGARGSGKIIAMTDLAPEDLQNTVLEELGAGSGRKTTIESAKATYELDKEVIIGAYLIPPALAGVDQNSGFSGEDLKEAYFVFNAITQSGRDTIEQQLNRILDNSIFNTRNIKIKKLSLDIDEAQTEGQPLENKK